MIKINLSPQRRPKTTDKGQRSLLIGLLIYVAAASAVYVQCHRPMQEELERLRVSTNKLGRENQDKQKALQGFDELKKTIAAAQERRDVILRLNQARAVPAHMLHELARILTPGRMPTMSAVMREQMAQNPNREFLPDWDPSHVWITSFTEKDGKFKLEGGAQSDSDMTQLALRMQASVYFSQVVPDVGSEDVDKVSGNPFYKFTITGKVAY